MADDANQPPDGADPPGPPLDAAIVRRFLASKEARTVAEAVLREIVPDDEVENLAGDAIADALEATPPRDEAALREWLATIARRRGADWLRKRKRRSKYEGPMPVQSASEDAYSGETADDADAADRSYDPEADREAAKLLGDALDRFIGDHKRDQETRAILREHAEQKKPYSVLARERGMTEAALANRIYRFKQKYGERVRRRERLVFFFRLGAAAVGLAAAAVLVWWLLHRSPGIRRDPSENEPRPAPSASARPLPTFDNAQPTDAGPPPEPLFPPKEQPLPPRR